MSALLCSQVPFGGFKQSGHGKELGEYALESYAHLFNLRQCCCTEVRAPGILKSKPFRSILASSCNAQICIVQLSRKISMSSFHNPRCVNTGSTGHVRVDYRGLHSVAPQDIKYPRHWHRLFSAVRASHKKIRCG